MGEKQHFSEFIQYTYLNPQILCQITRILQKTRQETDYAHFFKDIKKIISVWMSLDSIKLINSSNSCSVAYPCPSLKGTAQLSYKLHTLPI